MTTDKKLRYQKNLRDRKLAIVVLQTPAWPRVRLRTKEILATIEKVFPGEVTEVQI